LQSTCRIHGNASGTGRISPCSLMRPIILVTDPPDPETLSTRKLVLESAKFNVLTATCLEEAHQILDVCPVSAAIFHERALGESEPVAIIAALKKKIPDTPVLVLSPNPSGIAGAAQVLSSHDPIELVRFLQTLLNVPRDPIRLVRGERGPDQAT